MSPFEILVVIALLVIAVALLRLTRGRSALINPGRTDSEAFRARLSDELTDLITPLTGLKQDLDGLNEAVGEQSAIAARLAGRVEELAVQVGQFRPCESCPLRAATRERDT